MLISEKRLIKLINEEVEKVQILKESGAMPPASVLASPMPPAAVLDAETETIDTGLDISRDETLPSELSQAQKDTLKDVSRLANIQKMFDFTRPLLIKLVKELSDIDDILGAYPPDPDVFEKYRNEPEFIKTWAREEMGSGLVGWDSDNEQVDDLTTGVNPIENVKWLKDWMKNFYKLLKSEKDGRARSIEPHAKTLVDILTKLEAGFLMSPKLLGLTPAFKPSRAADNFGGAFPEMGDGWLGGGQWVPSIKDGDSVPSWKARYKYKVDKLTSENMSDSYWDSYTD